MTVNFGWWIIVLVILNLGLPMAYCIMPNIDDPSDLINQKSEEIKNQLAQADKKISDLQTEVNDFKTKEKSHFKIAIIVAIVASIFGGIIGFLLGKY